MAKETRYAIKVTDYEIFNYAPVSGYYCRGKWEVAGNINDAHLYKKLSDVEYRIKAMERWIKAGKVECIEVTVEILEVK